MRRPLVISRTRLISRTRFVRSPLAYWAMVGALALFTGLVAARAVRTADSLTARYGPLRPVLFATHRLDPGAEVGAADVVVRQVPGSMAPADALASTESAVGRTVVVAVLAGLPVMGGHLGASGLRGVAALLPPGSRAVAVPNGGAPLPLVPGDTVDVLATFDPSGDPAGAAGAEPTFPVARGALVVDVGDDSATVAVGPQEAARVAFAVTTGVVTLALAAPVGTGPLSPDPFSPDPFSPDPVSGTPSPAGAAPPSPPPPGR
ncbi:MAG: pilus assembly protein CpaB [Actinomycetota bacterium]|nr:pilus assembly protein CpaB [Actinomycetota bacterium]